MSKKDTEKLEIATKAKAILASASEGLKIGELRARLRKAFPNARAGTINSSAASLLKRFPDEVYEPAFGWRCHTKFKTPPPDNGGSKETGGITQRQRSKLSKILFDATPKDGKTILNGAALQKVQEAAKAKLKLDVSKQMYLEIRKELIADGRLGKGFGPGGSVYRTEGTTIAAKPPKQRTGTRKPKSDHGKDKTGIEKPAEIMQQQRSQVAKILFDATPKDGKSIPNGVALQKVQKTAKASLKLAVSKDLYFEIRNELIAKGELGKGPGRGGSVYRIEGTTTAAKKVKQNKTSEQALYPPLEEYLEQTWTAENDIKHFVVDRTANLGRKKTRGIWTRPDLSLVAIHTFAYIPGKTIELVTFEVKPANNFGIEGVFETAAHSRAAHRSYLMIHTPDGKPDREDKFDRLVSECERFHLGLIIFDKPKEWETFDTVLEADRHNPNPADVNAFIRDVMHKPQREMVSEMLR